MPISWEQVEGGTAMRDKIVACMAPKYNHVEQVAPEDAQILFTLKYKPEQDIVRMSVNGLTYYEGTHFTVDRDSTTPSITWVHTEENGGFSIGKNDKVFIDYWSLREEG